MNITLETNGTKFPPLHYVGLTVADLRTGCHTLDLGLDKSAIDEVQISMTLNEHLLCERDAKVPDFWWPPVRRRYGDWAVWQVSFGLEARGLAMTVTGNVATLAFCQRAKTESPEQLHVPRGRKVKISVHPHIFARGCTFPGTGWRAR